MIANQQQIIQQTLNDSEVEALVAASVTSPMITVFELSLAPSVNASQVVQLAEDFASSLAVPSVRIVSTIDGKDTVGIEVPMQMKEEVRLCELMTVAPEAKTNSLPLYLGKDASGAPIIGDLARMPHMLIAGATGSGKSVCVNSVTVGNVDVTCLPQALAGHVLKTY